MAKELRGLFAPLLAPLTPGEDDWSDTAAPLARDYQGRPALFEMNNAAGRFALNGVRYASAALLYAALGATVSGVRASFGGVEDTYEYFPTPGMNSLPTLNLTAGATADIVSNELVLGFTTGAARAASFTLAGYRSRAFRWKSRGRNSTATNPPALAHSNANSGMTGNQVQSSAFSTSMTERTVYGTGSGSGGNSYWGWRSGSGAHTLTADDASLVETAPLAGWVDWANGGSSAMEGQAWGGTIHFTMPALPVSGVKVFVQAGAPSTTVNRVYISVATDGAVSLIVRLNAGDLVTLALGTYAPIDELRITYGISRGTNTRGTGSCASVNGGPIVAAYTASDYVPGVSHIFIGQDASGGSLYDGDPFDEITFYKGRPDDEFCEFTSRLDNNSFNMVGDSYGDGAGGVALRTELATASGRKCINSSRGGATLAAQVSGFLAKPYLHSLPVVGWDGSDNGFVDHATNRALWQQVSDACGGRLLIIPSLIGGHYDASYADLVATFGTAHVFDAKAALTAWDANSANWYQGDGVHLNSTAMGVVGAAIHASGKLEAFYS